MPEQQPELYLAALRPGMLRLAGKEADGAILNWLAADDVPKAVAEVGRAAGPASPSWPASSSSPTRTRPWPGPSGAA